ncbi:hypothetical protein GUJ93_ZPchr0013g37332 [Zizania palustris]|uniref:Speckle-type POZ protein n=1 Tax=Zizania palustris TaxID=103762 RepID=A0A8J6C1H3_ZIZPA|nr:hypothetical protein GUJ93_ZPchr0013g37332 [Zizania palustris]
MAADDVSSAIVAEGVSRSHVIKIDGYSRIKGLSENGKYVSSIPFSVGGHSWIIDFYPNGSGKESEDYLSFYLCLDSACDKDVKAIFSFKLLDKNGGPVTLYSRTSTMHTFNSKYPSWGYNKFMKKTELEGSAYLSDDSFDIKCEITIMKEVCSKETDKKGKQFVVVPPADLHQHLGNLLVNMDGTNVTFDVGEERFLAHRCVLAARSSVFKAEFYGAMNVKSRRTIKIEDMEAGVFRSLLHFIYTDTLPDASQDHNCPGLKEACFEFLASPSNLESVMASDGYDHLKSSCQSVLTEFMARFMPPEMKALGLVMAPARFDDDDDDDKSLKGRKRMRVQE